MKPIKVLGRAVSTTAMLAVLGLAAPAVAFCGFYVAKADTSLFNESSKVVLVRDGDRTVITMASDYQGDPKEFAMVVPVPTVITKDQVHISKSSILDHLDAYTAPRLVEYHDDDPCNEIMYMKSMRSSAPMADGMPSIEVTGNSLGVTIEESFSVGEYDILVLSAKESDGLQTWLKQNGYKVPRKASKVLDSYIKQDMKFFVAKVNLEEKAKAGIEMLRPISVAFETPKFMLPIRLGTVNSKGTQDMFVYTLTKKGQVETTNYPTQKIPSNKEIPVFVKDEFGKFYTAMWDETTKREGGTGVFMEYAWDMGWCDPCAADPLSNDQLKELGVFWLGDSNNSGPIGPGRGRRIMPRPQNVFVTRLHVRYDAQSFPEDLKFQETGNRSNFQGRYIMRHAYEGEMNCEAAAAYKSMVNDRLKKEKDTLANLTGWQRSYIDAKVKESGQGLPFDLDTPKSDTNWWKRLWSDDE